MRFNLSAQLTAPWSVTHRVCVFPGAERHAEGGVCRSAGGRRQHQASQTAERERQVSVIVLIPASERPGPVQV